MLVITESTTDQHNHRSAEPIRITYGNHPTPFGAALVAFTSFGLCHLDFFDDDGTCALLQLRKNWPHGTFYADQSATTLTQQVFAQQSQQKSQPLRLHLRGTDFQLKVWQQLLLVPPGDQISYQQLARLIGQPAAARAVGRAVGCNPICYVIPCHRVIRSDGSIGGYRSGIHRKKILLDSEASQP